MATNSLLKKFWEWWGAVVGFWKKLKDTRELILWLVALGGVPTATLVRYWQATDSTITVNVRLLSAELAGIGLCLVALLWFSRRKEKEVERLNLLLPKKPERRLIPQEMILEILWKHPGLGASGIVRYIPHMDGRLVVHHLRILEDENLVWNDHDLNWKLNLNGEKYVVQHDLHNDRGQYFNK